MKQRRKTAKPEYEVHAADGSGKLTLAAANEEHAVRGWLTLTHMVEQGEEALPGHWEFVSFDADGPTWVAHAALPDARSQVSEYVGVVARKVRG